MNNRLAIRLTGSGGQGVILISVILAEAAVLNGDQAVQSQVYGPEARGGMCQADTIISNEEIWFSKPEKPDVLLSLTQPSMNRFSKDTTPSSVIIADTTLSNIRQFEAEGRCDNELCYKCEKFGGCPQEHKKACF